MPKTSSKSVSKAVPKKRVPAKPKRVANATKKPSPTKKRKKTTSKQTTVPKKPTTPNKKAATKRPSTATKTTKKLTTKTKPVVQKKEKKVTRKTTAKTIAKKPVGSTTAQKPTDKDSGVVLPTRMSIRAREKALVLADTFEKDFYFAGLTLAKAGGIAFLLLGSLVTYSQLTSVELLDETCATSSCNTALVGSAADAATANTNQDNYVELLADVPDIVNVKVGIPMQFSTAENVRAYVRHLSNQGVTETRLALEPIGNNKFEAYIDPNNLDPNQYELKVSVLHTNNSSPTVYSLGFFAILAESDVSEVVDDLPDSVDSTTTTSSQTTGDSASEQNTQPSTTTAPTASSTQSTAAIDKPVTYKETAPVGVKNEQLENNEPEPTKAAVKPETPVRIAAKQELFGIGEVSVTNAKRGEVVLFYIRPVQTLNTQSIGQLIPGVGTFRFDTKNFPNGQYQLYAERRQGQTISPSNTITFTIDNVTAPVAPVSAASATTTKRQLFDVASDLRVPVQQIADTAGTSTRTDFSVQDRARAVIATNPETLNDLFQRYAVAEQSGDPTLIAEAIRAIQNYRERLLSQALNDERDRLFAKELEMSLGEELDALINKVQTFETIRKDRTDQDSSTDTDGDGISDFDEINLYSTDPALADSDNDGFTDGAEIISGFNPNDAAAEAAIAYQSPKESVGVVTTQKLQVTEVVPEVELSAGDSANNVRAVVRGVGLPNSFVTLFVYSKPTIVTVRTEADGSFAYTFSKELEDGQHEVFVALTDNAGSIVAQSEVFTFIKEAQAFTPVDAQAVSGTIVAPAAGSQLSPYRIVLGMSVFALGILLVLLGVGLRSNRPDTVILQDKPV